MLAWHGVECNRNASVDGSKQGSIVGLALFASQYACRTRATDTLLSPHVCSQPPPTCSTPAHMLCLCCASTADRAMGAGPSASPKTHTPAGAGAAAALALHSNVQPSGNSQQQGGQQLPPLQSRTSVDKGAPTVSEPSLCAGVAPGNVGPAGGVVDGRHTAPVAAHMSAATAAGAPPGMPPIKTSVSVPTPEPIAAPLSPPYSGGTPYSGTAPTSPPYSTAPVSPPYSAAPTSPPYGGNPEQSPPLSPTPLGGMSARTRANVTFDVHGSRNASPARERPKSRLASVTTGVISDPITPFTCQICFMWACSICRLQPSWPLTQPSMVAWNCVLG
jgi:hypothetical protein